MKIKTVNIIAFLFLLLACSPYINFFVQEAVQKAIRHEMEEKMEQGMLHTLRVKPDAISWAEKNKEAWINGRLFDIKSSHQEGEYIILSGLYDEEETLLVKNLLHDQQKQNAGGSRATTGFFHVFGFPFPEQDESLPAYAFAVFNFAPLKVNIPSADLPVISPPPRYS